jgi:hypothetical protein
LQVVVRLLFICSPLFLDDADYMEVIYLAAKFNQEFMKNRTGVKSFFLGQNENDSQTAQFKRQRRLFNCQDAG